MAALQPTYHWRLQKLPEPPPDLVQAGQARGLSSRLMAILASRGYRGAADLVGFLDDPALGLHDPSLLPDAEVLRRRVERAVANRERALVFGDFDADGLTGLAILTLALRRLGIDADPYVPSRLDEGHGLSKPAVDRARAESRGLIVTADCGTSSVEEVAYAASAGIDVLVTDHHHVPDRLPRAAALVNPHRTDSRYPDANLSGSGVAFKVAQLLLRDAGDAASALELADLAAIGTVADVAPLVGENRCLVRLGLQRMREAPRPGIAALLSAARLDASRVDLDAIAYAVAPRINAAGRMGDAVRAARLLLTTDAAEADALAAELESANLERRDATQTCLAEARETAAGEPDAPAIVVAGPWPVGVIGLVAGRLADERGRPAVVFSTLTAPLRGSARSPHGFDLARAFERCADLFQRFGGHAQAAGCHLEAERLAAFSERFRALVGPASTDPSRHLDLDLSLDALEVDYRLYRELELLAPTGAGNPAPLVGIGGLVVTRVRAATGGHTQLTLRKGVEVLDGICFDRADLAEQVREGDRLDVVARLASRSFGGFESLQLEVIDAAAGGHLATLAVEDPAPAPAAHEPARPLTLPWAEQVPA